MKRRAGLPIARLGLPSGFSIQGFVTGDEAQWASIGPVVGEFMTEGDAHTYFQATYLPYNHDLAQRRRWRGGHHYQLVEHDRRAAGSRYSLVGGPPGLAGARSGEGAGRRVPQPGGVVRRRPGHLASYPNLEPSGDCDLPKGGI